jgi:RHS repeat-associated protein
MSRRIHSFHKLLPFAIALASASCSSDGRPNETDANDAGGFDLSTDNGDDRSIADSSASDVGDADDDGRIPTSVLGDSPFETRASLLGRLAASNGEAIGGATFTVYDDRATGSPRSDVVTTATADGGFRLRLTAFPETEPDRTPPHRLVVVIDAPSSLRAYRVAYAHPGDTPDLGVVRLVSRDPRVTRIGPEGGTATDSKGLVEIVVPPGALSAMVPVQITPFAEREDFPAVLPDSTLTMYGFETEPSGTEFAAPVTVRMANYRNLPTSLAIPVGSYDVVENRWEHEGLARWDGTRFAGSIRHFSPHDLNASAARDRVLLISTTGGANKSAGQCNNIGSSWRIGGGSIAQVFPLPATRTRDESFGLSLHYDSGLAGPRKLGPGGGSSAPTPGPSRPATSGLSVSVPAVTVQSFCVARGASGPSATQPGQCVVAGGSCGGSVADLRGIVQLLGLQFDQMRRANEGSTEAAFGGWVDLPLAGDGTVPATGFVTQTVKLNSVFAPGSGSACTSSGGTFAVPDAFAARVQIAASDDGPAMSATRKVLLHHRFSSPYGAGWAIHEVSRLYVAGPGQAVLVGGDGQEEEFRPRARVSTLPQGFNTRLVARDPTTGDVFVADAPGTIARLDLATGARASVLSGLAFPDEPHHALAIAYVGSARHFVVAFQSGLFDFSANGGSRQLATRAPAMPQVTTLSTLFAQSSLAARGSVVFYTTGDIDVPLLYRADLAEVSPTAVPASALVGDASLNPRAALSGTQFGHPLGLAFAADGALFVADGRRNAVYRIAASTSGTVAADSAVGVALGGSPVGYLLDKGEAQPALTFPMNQPAALTMAEDGHLLVLTTYGVVSFDTRAAEAQLLFLHAGGDEIVADFRRAVSFVALDASSLLFGQAGYGPLRVDVDPLSSATDPTRTIRTLTDGGHEIVDTSLNAVWRYEASGRLVEQRKRTGETDFGVTYIDARSDAIDHVTNAAGRQWKLTYTAGKLASITDPAGGRTTATLSAAGDLTGFVEPDGESHAFTYDAHHMTSKKTSRGDVTAYTFAADGTVASSSKPGGETYAFETVPTVPTTSLSNGRLARTGAYTDARGVRHEVELDPFGGLDRETYTADGVRRVVEAVHPPTLGTPNEDVSVRKNVFLRTAYRTVNGVALSPSIQFDSLGRPALQARAAGGAPIARWHYDSSGWLAHALDGPAAISQRFDRDAAGHILRVVDIHDPTGSPTGRETAFTWRSDGQPATVTRHGVTTTFGYDDAVGGTKNLLITTDTLGRKLTLGYDRRGNVTSVSDGTASSASAFDANNRLTERRDGVGNTTTFRYAHVDCGCTESDLVTSVHTPDLPAGAEWKMAYGAQGRLASVTDPGGTKESYAYETTGEVAAITDRLGRTATMTHDQLGRVLTLINTLGRRHDRGYTVPTAGTFSGPTLTAGSANGTAPTTSLSGALRSGDYQIGVNAHNREGFPAQISLYRDATFALAYTSYFDDAGRRYYRNDRSSRAIDSADVPASPEAGPFSQERVDYDPSTSASLARAVEAPPGNEGSAFGRNLEYDLLAAEGSGGGSAAPVAAYAYSRDTAGRLTQMTARFTSPIGLGHAPLSSYEYRPDGRLARVTNADGIHAFTYDARGLVATQTVAGEGTYTYGYDKLGRSASIGYPDGHMRHQVFDELGRITSRCYEYPSDNSLKRCYGAEYDAVGNPTRLTSPESDDRMVYDALDRLTKVTRQGSGAASIVETYDFNALGALKVNDGVILDHQRPRLNGAGNADAAVPATLAAEPVALDAGGRITTLPRASLTWSRRGYLSQAAAPVPAAPEIYGVDAFLRRVWKVQGGDAEFYAYEGADRIAIVALDGRDPATGNGVPGPVIETYLFAGVDHPLRMQRGLEPAVYFEIDLAGNVRRLRGPNGTDLGGYTYTAFGKIVTDDARIKQSLRWKGRWYSPIAGGIYDVRARQWSPELGSFLSVDEYEFQDPTTTLWAWPNQNPIRYQDPSGHDATTSNPIQDLVDSNLLPPGLTIFGKGVRMRANGISMMANDATFEAGMAKMNCGNAVIGVGAGVVGVDATVLVGLAQFAAGAAGGGGGGGGGGAGGPRGTSRPLTAADLGLKDDAIVHGTFSVRGDKATAYVQYLGKGSDELGMVSVNASRNSLKGVARAEGAGVLRIETSPLIEESGRLGPGLARRGFQPRGNGSMWWEGEL